MPDDQGIALGDQSGGVAKFSVSDAIESTEVVVIAPAPQLLRVSNPVGTSALVDMFLAGGKCRIGGKGQGVG